MAYVQDETQRVELTDPEYWVELRSKLTYGMMKDLEQLQNIETNPGDQLLKTMIAGWNLDDADGKVLPVEVESFNFLTKDDAELIITAINKQFEVEQEAKKASSSEPTQP